MRKLEKFIRGYKRWNKGTFMQCGSVCTNGYSVIDFYDITTKFNGKRIIDTTYNKMMSILYEDYPKSTQVPRTLREDISRLRGRETSKTVLWKFGDGKPVVNAYYLMKLCDILKANEIELCNDTKSPVKIKGKNGVAVLLPCCFMVPREGEGAELL